MIMNSLPRAAKRAFQVSAMLVLLGGFAGAQTSTLHDPIAPGRIGAVGTATAPGQDASRVRSVDMSVNNVDYSTRVSATSPVQSSEMIVGSGDLLEVSVYGAPEYVKQARVSSTGEITLPLAGMVKVGGLTTAQAETLIASKFSEGGFFKDPKVSVLEKEFGTQGISVLGEVQKPGIYPLPGARTLYDALSAAGGTTARAGNVVSLTHRNDPQNRILVTLSNDGKHNDQANIPVYPGDTVMVSRAGVVYVTGDVRLPGGFIMENAHMTVLQAVAMAQGANPTAALDRAKLIRNAGQGSQPEEVSISLKKILAAKEPDINLQPNDIVFVPNSAAKSAGRKTLDAIVQTATGMAVYGRMP